MLEMNGKELPYASFMKFTGHQFLKKLKTNHPKVLPYFEVTTTTRTYQFWKREALPIEIYSRSVVEQKLNYIHNNPLQEKWSLAKDPSEYYYSSASFYDKGEDPFGMLTHYLERIGG